MIKKVISLFWSLALMCSFVGASVIFSPQFGDERFPPADMLHAECLSLVDLSLELEKKEELKSVHLILNYEPDELQITQLKWKYKGSYAVGYDKLEIDFEAEDYDEVDFATIHLKSKGGVSTGTLLIDEESYYVTQDGEKVFLSGENDLVFAEVPECEPDIVAPNISVVSPEQWAKWIALDSYFIFDVKDEWKWVDKSSFEVVLNDVLYEAGNSAFRRSWSYLVFFPNEWLPVDEKISLEVRVSDLQDFGGPNRVEEEFKFFSASGMYLLSEVNPNMLRLFKQKTQSFRASASECALLNQLYVETDDLHKYTLMSIMEKFTCPIDMDYIASYVAVDDVEEIVVEEKPVLRVNSFSVFAVIGWILFLITLFLKLHYFHGYKKYKKYHKKNESAKNMWM